MKGKILILRRMMSQFKLQGDLVRIGQKNLILSLPKHEYLKRNNEFQRTFVDCEGVS